MRLVLKTLGILIVVMVLIYGLGSAYAADTVTSEESQRINVNELKTLVDKGETMLIVDVRSYDAFLKMHITGALTVPLHQVEDKLSDLSPDTKITFY